MKLTNIFILLFVLSAFAVGVGLQDSDSLLIDSAMDNASLRIENISIAAPIDSNITNAKGIFKIVDSGVKFAGIVGIETLRTGIYFGKDNPQYFSAEFIFKIIKLIIILAIISLLIQPTFYVGVFIIMLIIWMREYIKKKKFALEEKK